MQVIHLTKKPRAFVLLAALCLLILLLGAGCSGAGYRKSIPAKAFPSGNVLEIDMAAELNPGYFLAYGANQFSSGLTLPELAKKISFEHAELQNVFDDKQNQLGILIWVLCDNSTKDAYYLRKRSESDEASWYLFSGLRYELRDERDSEGEEGKMNQVLFPGFCLENNSEDSWTIFYNTPYLCTSVAVADRSWSDVPQAFLEFYEATGQFDVELRESVLSVQAKDSTSEMFPLSICFSRTGEQTYLSFLLPG